MENHLTLGVGYELADDVDLSLGYMHAFEKTIKETSAGGAFGLESSLYEDSLSFSVAWAF